MVRLSRFHLLAPEIDRSPLAVGRDVQILCSSSSLLPMFLLRFSFFWLAPWIYSESSLKSTSFLSGPCFDNGPTPQLPLVASRCLIAVAFVACDWLDFLIKSWRRSTLTAECHLHVRFSRESGLQQVDLRVRSNPRIYLRVARSVLVSSACSFNLRDRLDDDEAHRLHVILQLDPEAQCRLST